jgi:hypothetical protein
MPLLLPLPPSTSTPIFAGLYRRGLATVVPLAIFSTLASFTSAYLTPEARNGLIACGILTISNMAWTGIMMTETNARLCEIGEGNEKVRFKADESPLKEEMETLLKKWGRMNLVRSGICGVGAVIGLVSVALK